MIRDTMKSALMLLKKLAITFDRKIKENQPTNISFTVKEKYIFQKKFNTYENNFLNI